MATERWNDEMLDKLASSVSALRDEMKESIGALQDEVSGLRVTSQALLQIAAQHQRKMDQFEEESADRKREIEVMERKVEAARENKPKIASDLMSCWERYVT